MALDLCSAHPAPGYPFITGKHQFEILNPQKISEYVGKSHALTLLCGSLPQSRLQWRCSAAARAPGRATRGCLSADMLAHGEGEFVEKFMVVFRGHV